MSDRRPEWWGAVEALPASERDRVVAALEEALGPVRLRCTPITPTVTQEAFLRLTDLEVFFGGAAGGAKSWALLAAALQYIDVPGYAALILRRTYKQLSLPGALIDVARAWLGGTEVVENRGERRWTFPGGGTLTFGHLESENDKLNYQGAAFQFVGFDELTQFTESQYAYLFSRCRRPSETIGVGAPDGLRLEDVPLRVRGTGNPGGPGHNWVRRRLVSDKSRRAGARYVPSRLDDNPYLDVDAYMESLGHLPLLERRRLRDGDWTATSDGSLFDTTKIRVVSRADLDDLGFAVRPDGERTKPKVVRRWDLAATEPSASNVDPDYSVGLRMELDPRSGLFLVSDVNRFRKTAGALENEMARTAHADGRSVVVWIEQEPGSAGKNVVDHYKRTVLRGFACHAERATGDKETNARTVAAAVDNGFVLVLDAAWTSDFLEELEAFPTQGVHDDQVDAFSGAHRVLAKAGGIRLVAAG